MATSFTVVSLHAHPDDEALLAGGTLARAAADGHRVVLVTATAGEAGLADRACGTGSAFAARRRAELAAAAAAIGCQRVELLGYADSGMTGDSGGDRAFCRVDVDEAAAAVAALLTEEHAEVLTVYDARGGYGHPDHVAVHRVGVRAAELARTPVVLEATVDRTSLLRAARAVHRLPGVPADFAPARLAHTYTRREDITHVIDVRRHCRTKRDAMRAHSSQAAGGEDRRTLAVFAGLPFPLFRAVFGREWFVERGRPAARPCGDIFGSLR
jgi:LmbE family N-acetylglucosaminyl deacetylase